jgi:hypothetical protein
MRTRTDSADSSTSHSARARCRPENGKIARSATTGSRSMALSMLTVASDLLTGIPFERRSIRHLTTSPPRTGSSQLTKVATW